MQIVEGLTHLMASYDNSSLYVAGNLSQKRLSSAVKSHGVDPRDRVIAIIDSTIMGHTSGGSAENGMSLTLSGIYWRNPWMLRTRRSQYSWEELVEIASGIEAKGGNLQFEPGVEFYAPADFKSVHIINMLQALARVFEELRDSTPLTEGAAVPEHAPAQPLLSDGSSDHLATVLGASMALLVYASGAADEGLLDQAVRVIEAESANISATLRALEAEVGELGQAAAKSVVSVKLHAAKVLAASRPANAYEADQLIAFLEALLPSAEARPDFDRMYARIIESAQRSTRA